MTWKADHHYVEMRLVTFLCCLLSMLEYLAHESHKNFMEIFKPSTRTDITDEEYHEFRLELKRVVEEKQEHQPGQF